MNVDLAERMSPVDSEPLQRPIQRAKRTYGNKPKPITSEDDMRLSEPSFGASMVTAYTALDEHPRPTMTTSGYIPGRWLTDLKDMDKDIDDGEEDKDPHLRVAGEANDRPSRKRKDAHSHASSPPSDGTSRSASRQGDRRQEHVALYSANTSFASGSSAAKSSPSPPKSRLTLMSLPRSSFLSSDGGGVPEESPASETGVEDISPFSELPPSSRRRPSFLLRDKTPESPARNGRGLEENIFASPVKSFSKATAQIRERKLPRFLGDDSDEEMDLVKPDREEKMDMESELGWVTDGSDKIKLKRRSIKEPRTKIKKPSKKEVIEAEKETARIRAERDLDVQDKAGFTKLEFSDHFRKMADRRGTKPLGSIPPAPPPLDRPVKKDLQDADPISNFSSSPTTVPLETVKNARTHANLEAARQKIQKAKLQAIQDHNLTTEDDDSDELEIVPETPGNTVTPLDPVKRLDQLVAKKRQGKLLNEGKNQKQAPKLMPDASSREMTKEQHNRLMRQRVATQSTALMAHKKADFLERGGQLTKAAKVAANKGDNVIDLLKKATAVADVTERPILAEDSDEEDGDYHPEGDMETLYGSSPSKRKGKTLVPDSSLVEDGQGGIGVSLEEENHAARLAAQIPASEPSDTEIDITENEEERVKPALVGAKRRNIVVSDDEEEEESLQGSDGENIPPNRLVVSVSPQSSRFDLFPSLTRSAEPSMPARTPLAELKTSKGKDVFAPSSISLSPVSPAQAISPAQRNIKIDIPSPTQRSPLKRSGSSLLPAFEQSPTKSSPSPAPSSPFAFSSIFALDDEDDKGSRNRSGASSIGFKPANFGEISSQLFFSQPSPSQRASPCKRTRESLGKKDPLANLRPKDDDFLLTQPGPLGRIELSTQEVKELQRVDQIDADAAYREAEEERRKRLQETETDDEPRWINDAGLFTQTKPPEVPWSLTQNALSQSSLFFPQFGELDAEQMLSQRSPGKTPVRRLKRKGEVEAVRRLDSEPPSSPERPQNALRYLMQPKKEHGLDANNEFVHGEAEESDDELVLGFTRGGDDEDVNIDPEEEAKYLDDKKLTKDEIAEEAILEKHREHVAEDDAANQKLHEMATKGQLRKNKRGHGMLDDDSSDDENKARGAKFKKRKVQGTDDLDEIARNPETAAFYSAYKKDLPGEHGIDPEDNEFTHLNAPSDDIEADADSESDDDDEEMESVSEREWNTRKTLTSEEIRQEILQRADRGEDLAEGDELMSPSKFLEAHLPSSSDALLPGDYENIRMLSPRKRPSSKLAKQAFDPLFPQRFKPQKDEDDQRRRLESWAKQNEKGRETTSRGMASAAVTGHTKAAKTKGMGVGAAKNTGPHAKAPVRSGTVSSLASRLGKKGTAWE